jgi:hypothetical protein
MAEPSAPSSPRLAIVVEKGMLAQFFLLLQQGVRIRRRVGCSVEVFLRQEMGASAETIEKIQSIMLDGRPVDDIKSSLVHDGSTLALSAAMPGLVGATLRRGGTLSSFRSGITYHETEQASVASGWVIVKIFNLLMAEMGPPLFQTGVLVGSSDLLELLSGRRAELGKGYRATFDGKPVAAETLEGSSVLEGTGQVFVTIAVDPSAR